MTGFAKLHRKILEWEWYTDIPVKTLFIHLVLRANFEDAKWRGIDIKRGEVLTSNDSLSRETGLSVQQIRTAIKKLKSTSEITSRATNKNTIISVCNYETYNPKKDGINKQTNKQTNKRATNEQQTNNKQITTDKKNKEEIEEEYSFEDFWNDFDKKQKKEDAKKAWSKLSSEDISLLKGHIKLFVEATPDKQFRCGASVYLNQKRWRDEELPSSYGRDNAGKTTNFIAGSRKPIQTEQGEIWVTILDLEMYKNILVEDLAYEPSTRRYYYATTNGSINYALYPHGNYSNVLLCSGMVTRVKVGEL